MEDRVTFKEPLKWKFSSFVIAFSDIQEYPQRTLFTN